MNDHKTSVHFSTPLFVFITLLVFVAGAAAGGGAALWAATRDFNERIADLSLRLAQAQAQNTPPSQPQNTAGAQEILPDADTAETTAGSASYARRGPDNAPVQVVVFSDPRCPYCRKLAQEVEPELLKKYPDQVAILYRHFPVLGPDSLAASNALDCAGQLGGQDAFWQFHAALYDPADNAALAAMARRAGLAQQDFDACFARAEQAQVSSDFDTGEKLRVTGTPTTFVNGKRLAGALPLDYFTAAIDEALASAAGNIPGQ